MSLSHRVSRQHVVDMCHNMLKRGFLKATEGNISVRIPGKDLYAVTPSNYDYEKMRVEDICIMDMDGNQISAGMPASIEAGMHANVYKARKDVNAIVHTHQPFASALAFLRKPIPAMTDEQARFLGREVAIIDYAPSGTSFLAKNAEKKVASGANAFIIANHGVLTLGQDPEHAVFAMALLEKVSIAYLLAHLSENKDTRIHTVPKAIREVALTKLTSEQKRIASQIEDAAPPLTVDYNQPLPSADEAARSAQSESTDSPAIDAARTEYGPNSAELGYSISHYPDAKATMSRLKALIAQPVRGLRPDAMHDVEKWFTENCAQSKAITERAAKRIPGGVQHNLAFNYPFPLAIDRAEGAYLWDRDGNKYIDFLQAGGPTILGSNYGPVRQQVEELVRESGPVTGLFHEYELKLAEVINYFMPGIEMYRSLGSGTEGVMAAIRGARAYTGNRKIIKVGGAYHGWSDQMVYGLRVPGTWRMNAKGIPMSVTRHTRESFPHSISTLKRKLIENRAAGGTAAVIVEPVGPESGTRPAPYEFNAQVRELCDEFGALLIFDEVVTGFRLGMGGAQGYFGVQPDLTVFGKAVSGGYPMAGGVGGSAEIMSVFGAGLGGKHGAHVQVGGTLSANPLSNAAGYFAIKEMARTNAPVVAGRAGDRLTAGLQRLLDKYGLPYVAYNQGSIVHLETSGVMLMDFSNPIQLAKENKSRKELMEKMGAAYTANGIITLAGSRLYTSLADTDEVIDDALSRFDGVFAQIEGV